MSFDAPAEADKAAARLRAAGVGARVEMTEDGIAQGLGNRAKTGVITGYGRHKWTVLVRKDGTKHATSYYVGFWRPLRGR